MTIGLLGGSFNPVHIGHTMVAEYIARFGDVDAVWLVLSPRNPLKDPAELIDDHHRLAMLRLAAEGSEVVDVCDIELQMPRPSYTIDTLRRLRELYPQHTFRWITGYDNLLQLPQWKDWRSILSEFGLLVYPRDGADGSAVDVPEGARIITAPQIEVSSTMIRRAVGQGILLHYFLPHGVANYIKTHNLYANTTDEH